MTETERYDDSQIVTGSEHESNYRIITDTASQSPPSPNSNNWNDILFEKDTDFTTLNTDNYKLKYRRNRLKQKLRELRDKALELAKQMASDSNSQQNIRLRQVMNRYEKQIENLSKLHNRLSAALSISKEAINENNDSLNSSDNKYPCINLNERNADFSANNNSPVSSPEPPKLSPRSSLDCHSILPEEVRNSPPILPKICLTISSSQDSVEEELQVVERKVWPVNEELIKSTFSTDPLPEDLTDSVDKDTPDIEKHVQTMPVVHKNNINIDIESSNSSVNKRAFNHSNKVIQSPENNHAAREKKDERNKSIKGFTQCRLVIQEPEKIKCLEFPDVGPIISSVANCVEIPTTVQGNKSFEVISNKQFSLSRDHTVQPNFYESNQEKVPFSTNHEDSINSQKVRKI